MEPLFIKGDEVTPTIDFNANSGILKMSGLAVPENVKEMFAPVNDWLNSYLKAPQPATELVFYFEYLNTAASKMIFDIGNCISELHGQDNFRVKVIWQYSRGDHEMLELGEEMIEEFLCLTEIQAIDEPHV